MRNIQVAFLIAVAGCCGPTNGNSSAYLTRSAIKVGMPVTNGFCVGIVAQIDHMSDNVRILNAECGDKILSFIDIPIADLKQVRK